MPTQHDTKGKVLVIVEETVQRAFLMDCDDANTPARLATLKGLLLGDIVDPAHMFYGRSNPPRLIDRRAKKGVPIVRDRQVIDIELQDAEWQRFTGLTIVLPDEDGQPALEQKFTPKTIQQKPVKK